MVFGCRRGVLDGKSTKNMGMSMAGAIALACGLALAPGAALADMPAALDRVPQNAVMVVSVDNIEKAQASFKKWAQTLGEEFVASMGEGTPVGDIEKLLATPGLRKDGSIAAFVTREALDAAKAKHEAHENAAGKAKPTPEGEQAAGEEAAGDEWEDDLGAGDEPEMPEPLVLVPVTEFQQFVTGLGGTPGTGVVEVTIDDEAVFVRDLGAGYALMGPDKALVEAFTPVTGAMKDHAALLGANGAAIANDASVLVIGNVQLLQAEITEGMDDLGDGMGDMAAMPGLEGAQAGLDMFKGIVANWARDSKVGVLGMGMDDAGMWIDLGTQFKPGSELAGLFNDKGSTTAMLERLPDQEFLMVSAMDTRGAGMKKMMTAASQGQDPGGMAAAFANMGALVDSSDGAAMMMGSTPGGLMGGMFVNTTMLTMTKDTGAYVAATKEMMNKIDNTTSEGMTFDTTWTDAAQEVAGVKVDRWNMQIKPDPNDPNGQQTAMAMAMMFGPRGIGGFHAPVDGAVVSTMSENRLLLANAIEVARSGKGLGSTQAFKDLQKVLPPDRTVEAYIGVKPILETVQGFAAMMGGGGDFQVPEKITPIAMGVTTHSEGMRARIYVPTDVMIAFRDMAGAMQAMQGQGMEEEEPMGEDEPPRF